MPRGANPTLLSDMPRVLSPGNVRTLPADTDTPKTSVLFPGLVRPSKKKSSDVISEMGLQGKL